MESVSSYFKNDFQKFTNAFHNVFITQLLTTPVSWKFSFFSSWLVLPPSACLNDVTVDTCSSAMGNVASNSCSSSRELKARNTSIKAYEYNATMKKCTSFEFLGCRTINVYLDRNACKKGKNYLGIFIPHLLFWNALQYIWISIQMTVKKCTHIL